MFTYGNYMKTEVQTTLVCVSLARILSDSASLSQGFRVPGTGEGTHG